MEWIVDPIGQFNELTPSWAETCPHTWLSCTCDRGQLVCTVVNALNKD